MIWKAKYTHVDYANGTTKRTYFGIPSLDKIGGMAPGEYIILCGETEMGKTTCAIEANVENFTMMKRLVEHLAARLASDLPNRMTPIYDWYPTRAAEYVDSDTILAFPSLSWTLDAAQERTIFDSLSAAGGVILSLYDFFTHRAEPAEQEALVAQIRERGFEAPIEISSWEGANMGFRHDRHVFMRKSGGR